MNLFTLFGSIAINNSAANKAIANTSQQAQNASKKMDKSFEAIGKAAKKCGKAIAAGLAAGTAALGTLLKASIGEFAEYEQLVGGVKKLFGDNAKEVMKYANEAYKSAGMSANDYMQTVTSFSASLIAGLGNDTAKAAELSNMAITDMADNANTFGTSMSSIQDAYQGFAKQNYTMLDNLKLGYGGTAAEMARLINDSGVLGSAITVTADTVNQVSFDKIIEAIHVIQKDMKITGTTTEEAGKTIAGSFSMFKASWKNLLTGLANEDADMDTLIDQFIGSTETLGKNVGKVLPRLRQTVGRLASRAMEEVRTRISAGWNNTVWPFIQEQMRLRFGIELPDWGTFVANMTAWWTGSARPWLENAYRFSLRFLGLEPWSEQDEQDLLEWWNDVSGRIVEVCKIWLANPEMPDVGATVDAITAWWNDVVRNSPPLMLAARILGVDVQQGVISDSVIEQARSGTIPSQSGSGGSWFRNLFGGGSTSNRSTGGGAGRGFANGLYRVPYDGFQATLHKDEAVLNRLDASEWRTANAHGYGADNSRLEALMGNVVSLMQQVAANTAAGNTVVLDTGVIVGQLAPGIDRQLGSIASRKGRG